MGRVADDEDPDVAQLSNVFERCEAMWIRLTSLVVPGRHEDGQTMVEYAVVLGMITLAVVATFTALSGGIGSAVSTITGRI